MSDLSAWLDAHRAALEDSWDSLFADVWPDEFQPALRYPLKTGGKRIRPALVWAAFDALAGTNRAGARAAAIAWELVHTYSLVHDDLPDMDDDDTRRGMPTVHVAFNPATAILAGDALLTEAFSVLAEAPMLPEVKVELVRLLAGAAGARGMVGGQAADIGIGGNHLDEPDVLKVHARKTGALLASAVVAGGVVAGATQAQRAILEKVGIDLGLAFQLVDDVLDHGEDAGPNLSQILGREATLARAQALVAEATAALSALPSPGALLGLAHLIVERTH